MRLLLLLCASGLTVFSHGVMNWSKADHWGYTNETGIMTVVKDGKFQVLK